MDRDHRKSLTKCQLKLLDLLNPEDYVLDYLLSEEIISSAEKDKVSLKPTPKEQTRELLDIVPRKGAKAWDTFLEGLRGSEAGAHREAADALEEMLTQVKAGRSPRPPRRVEHEGTMLAKTPASHKSLCRISISIVYCTIYNKIYMYHLFLDIRLISKNDQMCCVGNCHE